MNRVFIRKISQIPRKMAENDATNGHTEAATDLEKKIIKQIEVSKTIKQRSETFMSCLLHQY